jgi:hypothetical protein
MTPAIIRTVRAMAADLHRRRACELLLLARRTRCAETRAAILEEGEEHRARWVALLQTNRVEARAEAEGWR